MMIKQSKQITKKDNFIIYTQTAKKVFNGLLKFGIHKKFPIFVGSHVNISHRRNVFCGKNVKFESYSEIHGLSTHGLHFGNNVTIGRFAEIRPSSYYGVGKIGYGLEMGDRSSIGPFGFVGCSGPIKIGKDVMIGPRVSLFAENHNFKDKTKDIKDQGVNNKGITIEDNCWIGSGVIILDGVTIGAGSVIGAGTLVTKDIPQNSIVYDKRSKVIRQR